MDTAAIIAHTRTIIAKAHATARPREYGSLVGSAAEAIEVLRHYLGPGSQFEKNLSDIRDGNSDLNDLKIITTNLEAFIRFVEAGMLTGPTIVRAIQLDTVSDYLEQAQQLLAAAEFHPAVAAVIIGASLEEFLRNWVEELALSLEGRKPGIDTYVALLRGAETINKQDVKDITSWAGLRNSAAHGLWDEVSDRQRIGAMLEGVNLFLRRYSGR